MATKVEALQDCQSVLKDNLRSTVLVDKYFLCDEKQQYFETRPQHMWNRLAVAGAAPEKAEVRSRVEDSFREILTDFHFVPGGRILYGLGNPYVTATLKNCYVNGILEDSIKGIFDCGYQMAETYKTGGGTGTDISILRPWGSPVHNAARTSSGAVNFMDFYSHITGMIGQQGRIGALLLSIDVSHPDIKRFIAIKGSDDLNKVRYANVSVKITDEFMNAVIDDQEFPLRWGGQVYEVVRARELWDLIIKNAWKRAEPGLLFWDAVLREYPAAQYERFKPLSTNPCGELALSHGDSCCLGSVNLGMYVEGAWTSEARMNYQKLDRHTRQSVRFLDNIISLEKSPMEFQQWANDNGRRLGLGIMGLADVFMKMGIKFDSDQAMVMAEKISHEFMVSCYDESCELAKEKGSFPAFDLKRHMESDFIKRLPEPILEKIQKNGIRNIGNQAIAPTGSIAIIAGCSSAAEPVFEIHHTRKTNLGTAKEVKEFDVWHPAAKEYAEKYECRPDQLPDFFQSSHQVDNKARVRMQSLIQRNIDQSISNTFNLPESATPGDISDLYMDAYRLKLKGITVYRDGSREGVLVSADKKSTRMTPKRPDSLDAKVHIIKPNGKTYTVFVGLHEGRVFEVFALDNKLAGLTEGMDGKIVKVRNDDKTKTYNFESGALLVRRLNAYEDQEASLITRLISTCLRHGVPLVSVIKQISQSKELITSFSKAIAKALSLYIKPEDVAGLKCHKCQSTHIKLEGLCLTCMDCGNSKCG